jgi:tetratricopeptide (TPR) repeat protein
MLNPVHPVILSKSTVLLGLLLLTCLRPVYGNPARLFKAGNKAYAEERYGDAIESYAEALGQDGDAAEIYYNLGNAQFRSAALEDAIASYEYAASMTERDGLKSQSWFNAGNCMMKMAEGFHAEDPQTAISLCRQAAWFYRMALDYNNEFAEAAYNLEVSQLTATFLQEEVRRQEEEEKQQNELISYIREKLQEFIERQGKLLEAGDKGDAQEQLERDTRELAQLMEQSGLHNNIPLPDGSTVAGPLGETYAHTKTAADAMAALDQPVALAELIAALGAAPEDPNRQDPDSDESSEDYEDYDMEYEESDEDADMYEEADPFGDFSEYEEIRGVPPPNQTEMDILAEEIRNQERRKEKKAGEYRPVDKDW